MISKSQKEWAQQVIPRHEKKRIAPQSLWMASKSQFYVYVFDDDDDDDDDDDEDDK